MIQTSTIDGEVSVFMPLKLKKRSGRKMILAPPQGEQEPEDSSVDLVLLKALVKAHLWKRQLKSGKFRIVKELSEQYGLDRRYVQQIMRLNFLAPKFKEAILFGKQPRHLKLADLIDNIPVLWNEQEEKFGIEII